MRELLAEMWETFLEEWGRSCLIFVVPAGASWLFHNFSKAMGDLNFVASSVGIDALCGAGVMIPYLFVRAHLSLRAKDRAELARLQGATAKGNFEIWLEEVLDPGTHDYYFRGHIFNRGDSVENVLVRLVDLKGSIPPGTKDMNLQWSGGQQGPRDIDNEHDAIFDIAKTPRYTPKPLRFWGWEGSGLNRLYSDVEAGPYSFCLHITGHKMQKIKVPCEIEYAYMQEKSVTVIKPKKTH